MEEVFKEHAQQQMEGCSGFAFAEELLTFSLSVSLLQCLLDRFRHCLKADNLTTCDFFICLKDTQVCLSVSLCQLHIRYEYWKQSALWNRKGLACETTCKPTFYKHKQKQMQPSLNKHKSMVQRSQTDKNSMV